VIDKKIKLFFTQKKKLNYVTSCHLFPTFDFSNFSSKDTIAPKAQHVLANVFFGKIVKDMEVDFNMTTREETVFGCLKVEHAQDFLLAIPTGRVRATYVPC
jgi:hypothetical protein